MDAVERAKSGHPGMPMGLADIAALLFTKFLRFDPEAPDWPDRDRFVLSNGHGSVLLYGLLHLLGYPGMTMAEIERFRQLGSGTAGHPERGRAAGIEVTNGPVGQGLANAVGMALAERLLAAEFGDGVVDHHTYVFCGDGRLMEGISHEAISLAGHLRLNKLIVLYDDNSVSIDGPTDLAASDDQFERFRAHGRDAERIDGHDTDTAAARAAQLGLSALRRAGGCSRPMAGRRRARCVTAPSLGSAARRAPARAACRVPAAPAEQVAAQSRRRDCPAVRRFPPGRRRLATRQASGMVLDALATSVPELLGGSADPVEQHQGQRSERNSAGRFHRPLCALRRARTRHEPEAYRDAVLGAAPRVAVEAAMQFGWERWLGDNGAFVGMSGFGASAPGEARYDHFGITPERVAAAARSLL